MLYDNVAFTYDNKYHRIFSNYRSRSNSSSSSGVYRLKYTLQVVKTSSASAHIGEKLASQSAEFSLRERVQQCTVLLMFSFTSLLERSNEHIVNFYWLQDERDPERTSKEILIYFFAVNGLNLRDHC